MSVTKTRHSIRDLASFTTDPYKAGEKMLEAVKSLEKVTRRQRALNLVHGLVVKKIGTNNVEKAAILVVGNDERDEGVVVRLMKILEEKSKEKLEAAKMKMWRSTRIAVKLLPAGWMRRSFFCLRSEAAQQIWEEGRLKNQKKEDHLEAKVKPRKENGFVEDIPVGDVELESEKNDEEEVVEVKTYGVEVNDAEKEYLKIPNSMTDFKKMDVEEVLTCVQVTAAKLRMAFRNYEDSQGLEKEQGDQEIETRMVYDEENKEVDFRKKRATDLPTNKRISAPKAAAVENEIKIQMLVQSLENIVKKAGKEEKSCPRAGRTCSSLTEQALEGRRSLLQREKAGELVILGSDKSGERVVMETKLYTSIMSQHTEGDTVSTREEVNLAEKRMNAAANQMVRMLKFGEEWNHEDRIKSAAWAQFNKVPSLGGLVKTHKEELKLRPVCYAKCNQCPNGPLACLLCVVLDPYIEGADRDQRTEVESTEELCHQIGVVNHRITKDGLRRGSFQQNGNLEVGSLDVKNFYPSIDVEVAAEEVKQEILESDVEVKGVNYEEAALFLACTMTQVEVDDEGLTHVVHKRKTKNGRRPGITCKAISGGPVEREKDGSWVAPSRFPTSRQKRRMVACVIKNVIILVMKNQFYSFNNQIFRQEFGAGIGNQASEKLGKLLMKRFDRKFLLKLNKLKIEVELFKRYVDDVTTALTGLEPGVRFDNNKMIVKQELVEEDRLTKADKRTMVELAKIAGTVYQCLDFTSDCPSSQEGGKVPVLDLKLYIGDQGLIKHEFYEKPVTCRLVIPERSAHSWKMKIAVMVEEGLRRLRNHSRELDWETSRKCMIKWALKLKRSGYSEQFRHQVIKAALEKWRKMCKTEDEGGRPVYRPREWRRRERRLAKVAKQQSWHKVEGQISAPLILDPVPGPLMEKLKSECTKFERQHGIKVKICPRAGKSVTSDARPEPLRRDGCERLECMPCQTAG